MSSLQSQVASGSNSIAQYAAEEALRSPKGREAIERMHRAYDERRRHIVQRLKMCIRDRFNTVKRENLIDIMKGYSSMNENIESSQKFPMRPVAPLRCV